MKAKLKLIMPFSCWCIKGRGLHKHYKILDLFTAQKELKRYNNQRTKCFCPCCDNELCGSNSWLCSQGKNSDIEFYKCSKCGTASKWDFGAPCPILVETGKLREISGICNCGCEIAKMVDNQEICANCNLTTGATRSI
jgi:hypothetical protein